MGTYFVSCIKNTAKKSFSVRRIKQNGLMLVSNCVVCDKKKTCFIKNQDISRSGVH